MTIAKNVQCFQITLNLFGKNSIIHYVVLITVIFNCSNGSIILIFLNGRRTLHTTTWDKIGLRFLRSPNDKVRGFSF